MIRRSEKSCKEGVCSIQCFCTQHAVVHVSVIMHILPGYRGTYIWGVCTFGVLQPTANFSKNWRVLIFGGVLIYGVLRYLDRIAEKQVHAYQGHVPVCACVRARKTPLISTFVFSGLATKQVLNFGAVLTFKGYDKAEWKILQGGSLFNPVLLHTTRCCACFSDYAHTSRIQGYLYLGGMYFRGIATDSKFQ